MKHLTIHVVVLSAILSSQVLAETETTSTDTSVTMTTEMSTEMSTEAATIESMASSDGSTVVVEKLSNDYQALLGDNAETVINGLRKGEEFTLTTTTDVDGVQVTESATIASPTGKMGFGNVSHTLALTEYQLTQLGITDPTLLELEAALLGGSVTLSSGEVIEMQGVLALRSEGMGWGQIAQQYDTKLGYVISAIKSGRPIPVASTDAGSATSGVTSSDYAGKSTHVKTVSNGNAGSSHGYKYGQGITTASGGSIGAGHASAAHGNNGGGKAHQGHSGNAYAYGGGIVSANGAGVSASAAHSAGGSNAGGNGHGKGRGR